MILLDTHIWVWWIHGDRRLAKGQSECLQKNEEGGLGVSIISCWEVAKLVEYGRLKLPCPIEEWFSEALNYPGIQLIDLTPEIIIESTRLPGEFHRDPADQLIVATARVSDYLLLTADSRILNYSYIKTLK